MEDTPANDDTVIAESSNKQLNKSTETESKQSNTVDGIVHSNTPCTREHNSVKSILRSRESEQE